MKIKKIEWKNFGSYGNRKQTLELPEESGLFQVVGGNGMGKTTISQVISFALYGKVEGKKIGDIPNRINGHTWVKIEFESSGKVITIERGIEPSLFNLYIDGVLYDQSGVKNVQEYLSEDLIGIPYYVFNNTISLSINDFKSFIKMSPQDKRVIVDKIFGFHILNQMREALKTETRKIKESLDMISGSISSTEKSMSRSNEEMENLLKKIEEESKDKLKEMKESLDKFNNVQEIHSQKISDFKKQESDLMTLISESNRSVIESRRSCQDLEKKMRLYDSEKCPTCEGSLLTEFHLSLKENLKKESSKFSKELGESESNLKNLKSQESELMKIKSDLQEKGSKIRLKISEILGEIKKLESSDVDSQVSSLSNILKKLEEDKKSLDADLIKANEKSLWVKKLDDVLGEKGVKQMAIKTILPSLNSEIIELLREMDLPYQVIFDEEFKASLHHMGMEIPVQSLSTGEMKKVDFVVLIAIMKLMKLKFSTINLLFLDELFSSVDSEGIYSILKILKKNTREMGLNIFVINHAPMPHEIFDWKLEVSKNNNFSTISIDKF